MTKKQKSSKFDNKKPYNEPPTEEEYKLMKKRAKDFSEIVQKNLYMSRDNLRPGSAIKTGVRGTKWLKEAIEICRGKDNKKQQKFNPEATTDKNAPQDPNHPVYRHRFNFNIDKFILSQNKIGNNGYPDKFTYNRPPSDDEYAKLRNQSREFSEELRAKNRKLLRPKSAMETTKQRTAIETRPGSLLNAVREIYLGKTDSTTQKRNPSLTERLNMLSSKEEHPPSPGR
ncbi:MAG: hypothetical protein ISP24_02570 [Rickettsiales bacterium]|nr:hypothetical protein [Rickettsiales bacterium]